MHDVEGPEYTTLSDRNSNIEASCYDSPAREVEPEDNGYRSGRRLPLKQLAIAVVLLLGLGAQVDAADLTLKHVMLSSGGVGYFEYAADIDGDAMLGLDVPLGHVDDILKSLVVFDSTGGVAGVELPGRDNTIQAFGDAPIGPEALESPTAYLNALTGTEVMVQGPRPMTGQIIRAEPVTETTDKVVMQRTRVTLLSSRRHAPVRVGGRRYRPDHRSRVKDTHRTRAGLAAARRRP